MTTQDAINGKLDSTPAKAETKAENTAKVRAPAKPKGKAPASAKATSKPAAKSTEKSKATVSSKSTAKTAAKVSVSKDAKTKKPKMVRDSFTFPKAEYAVLDSLKLRAATLGNLAKKTELLRAGVKAIAAMQDAAFLEALKAVPNLKTGRPAKAKAS